MSMSQSQLLTAYEKLLQEERRYFAATPQANVAMIRILAALQGYLDKSQLNALEKHLRDLNDMITVIKNYNSSGYKKALETYNANKNSLALIAVDEKPLSLLEFPQYLSFTPTLLPPIPQQTHVENFESYREVTSALSTHGLRNKMNGLNENQQADLTALCDELDRKIKKLNTTPMSDKKHKKESDAIYECIEQTSIIIDEYKQCQQSITFALRESAFTRNALSEAPVEEKVRLNQKLIELYGRENDVKTASDKFITNVKAYEKKCAKWNLGQKIFIGACTFVGGLLGAVLGAAAGLAAGAAIGGGVGSVVPLFGNIAGAVVAGNVGAIVGIVKGIGLGAAIGTAAATAIMGAGVGYGAKKGAGSSLFMTKQQKFVTGLKRGMEKEIKSDAKDAKKLINLNKEDTILRIEKDELDKPGTFFLETRKKRKNKKMEKVRKEFEDLATKIQRNKK